MTEVANPDSSILPRSAAIPISSVRQFHEAESRQWDEFVCSVPDGHLLQTWGWGEFKRGFGWKPVRLALVQRGEIIAAAQVLLRSLAGMSVAYVPRGPVVAAADPASYVSLIEAIHRLARTRRSVFLKIEPNERAESGLGALLHEQGFKKSRFNVQPPATLILDLTGGEESVLARMKSKTRYNVRLAERRGVQVRRASNQADLRRFHELVLETSKRDHFRARSLSYYDGVLEQFRSRGQAELMLAEFAGAVIAGVMVFASGADGIYMHGASSNQHRREMPNHLLQWRAIQWCMQKGCSRYDFWGVPEQVTQHSIVPSSAPDDGGQHNMWGVYRFKQGFGGELVHYLGAYDYVYLRPFYLLWTHMKRNRGL